MKLESILTVKNSIFVEDKQVFHGMLCMQVRRESPSLDSSANEGHDQEIKLKRVIEDAVTFSFD